MTISINNYVDITSGVSGAPSVSERELIQRIFTDNPLVPVNSFIEFSTLAQVGEFFGTTSEEYQRAVGYFGFVSKSLTSPQKISYAGYSFIAVPSLIIGAVKAQILSDLQVFTSADLTLTIGANNGTTAPIDLSSSVSVADAMSIIEAAIQAANVDPSFSSATVNYDPIIQRITFTCGENGLNPITVTSTTNGFLAQLGWVAGNDPISNAIFSDGTDGNTVTEILTTSDSESDNFGSIVFVPTLDIDDAVEAATWNDAQNVKYFFCHKVALDSTTIPADIALLDSYAGTGVTLANDLAVVPNDFAESIPAILLAATRYENVNSSINYMFQQVNVYPATVTTDSSKSNFDSLRVNYNGETQTAGQKLTFYQQGVLLGPLTAPRDMNTYANEMWFKSAITTSLVNLLLAVEKVPSNSTGIILVTGAIQSVINRALDNGVISVGKLLTDTQKAVIKSLSNSNEAVTQVQTDGYWLNVVIVQNSTTLEFEAQYILIYSKDDVVRSIDGNHVLI